MRRLVERADPSNPQAGDSFETEEGTLHVLDVDDDGWVTYNVQRGRDVDGPHRVSPEEWESVGIEKELDERGGVTPMGGIFGGVRWPQAHTAANRMRDYTNEVMEATNEGNARETRAAMARALLSASHVLEELGATEAARHASQAADTSRPVSSPFREAAAQSKFKVGDKVNVLTDAGWEDGTIRKADHGDFLVVYPDGESDWHPAEDLYPPGKFTRDEGRVTERDAGGGGWESIRGLPPTVKVKVYDNGGETADRYTVVIQDPDFPVSKPGLYPCASMSGEPEHPQGVSSWGECKDGTHLGKRIKLSELPDNVQKHAIARIKSSDPSESRSGRRLAGMDERSAPGASNVKKASKDGYDLGWGAFEPSELGDETLEDILGGRAEAVANDFLDTAERESQGIYDEEDVPQNVVAAWETGFTQGFIDHADEWIRKQ